jgi:uncharacterized protein (UPF0335 family)
MIDKLLRPFVADQLKALMEKLETQEIDARSLRKIGEVLSELKLTRFERYVVGRVYKRVRRVSDMNRLMEEIIMGQPETAYDMAWQRATTTDLKHADINAKLRHAMDNGLSGNALWNGVVPQEQTKRVITRPKVKAL